VFVVVLLTRTLDFAGSKALNHLVSANSWQDNSMWKIKPLLADIFLKQLLSAVLSTFPGQSYYSGPERWKYRIYCN